MNERLASMTADRLARASTWAASLWWTAWLRAGKPSFR
jgi:hypothetical protein